MRASQTHADEGCKPRMQFRARGAPLFEPRTVEVSRRCGGPSFPVVDRRLTGSASVGECRARLCEIKCQSREGLRCCAGRVAEPRVAHVVRVMRSRSARLRRYGSGSILLSSFGGLPSVELRAARDARQSRCHGAGAASMKSTQDDLTTRSSARRVSAACCRAFVRAGAQRER